MKKAILTAAVAAGVAAPALRAAPISYSGGVYTENFNGLPSSGTVTSPFTATIGAQAEVPGEPTFQGAKIAGTGTGAMPFVVSNGSGTTLSGGIYSLGATDSTDRALGSVASGSNTPAYGTEVVNDTGLTITGFTLAFTAEQFRSASGATGVPNTVAFAYGTSDVTTSSTFLTDPDLTPDTRGDLVSTYSDPAVVSNPPLTTARSVTVGGLMVDPGESIFFRFSDFNEVGNDAAIGIDDLSFSAVTVVPEPAALGMLGAAGLLALRRRRR